MSGKTIPDFSLQRELLDGVSRTFALTIPALPERLERVVGNAYLLCRIADTIEDAASLTLSGVRVYSERFIAVVTGRADPGIFAREFAPHLSPDASVEEQRLIAATERVLGITATFDSETRAAVVECVVVMARGMADFQCRKDIDGLADLDEHARYCYVVAGCVGEMLTRLFIAYLPELDPRRTELLRLSVSFGQALQMTNILKDFWEDRRHGACWLPRDIFLEEGLDLSAVCPGDPRFTRGYRRLIGLARGHAERALRYILILPRREAGIRNFCLWALFMSLLTLRKLQAHPDFADGNEVKITRRSVHNTVLWCRMAARENLLVKSSFRILARGLPSIRPGDFGFPEPCPTKSGRVDLL